jgi:hypothetical protein
MKSFDKIATRYIFPVLLVMMVVAIYFEFTSVQTIEYDIPADPSLVQSRELKQGPRQKVTTVEPLMIGDRFRSLKELVAHQQSAGFVRVGLFGAVWPAKVAEVQIEQDRISFVRGDGTRHNYNRFDGYTMKMVRLKQDGQETIVVFRSENKR